MTGTEAKLCMYRMGDLWNNYKPPQDDLAMNVQVETWLRLFGSVSFSEVENVIFAIAADGKEFAPQIGQIYAKLKELRAEKAALKAPECDPDYYRHLCLYAREIGVEPPPNGMSNNEMIEWFERVKERKME